MAASKIVKGVYSITCKKTPTGRVYYLVSGYTEAGERLRRRKDNEVEAKEFKGTLEVEDSKVRLARAHAGATAASNNRCVWSSDIITDQTRVADCEDALRLFPKGTDGLPSREYSVKAAVKHALQFGYNPVLPSVTMADVSPLYVKHLAWRGRLAKDNPNFLSEIYLGTMRYYRRLTEGLCGGIPLSVLAAPGKLESLLNQSSLTYCNQQKVASYMNGLMEWAVVDNTQSIEGGPPAHPKYLATFQPYYPPQSRERKDIAIMSLEEIQTRLDSAWDLTMRYGSSRAPREIVRIFCALRPSEVDNPDFSVSEDLTTAKVPDDSKTGWRCVPIPPNARIMLRVLKQKGLLSFRKESLQTLGIWHGQLGYYAGTSRMRSHLSRVLRRPYSDISKEEAEQIFRGKYPFRPEFGNYVPDKARHTGGSYHVSACQDIAKTAIFMGNTEKVVEDNYWGKVDIRDVPRFYGMIVTQMRPSISDKIDMPFWFEVQHAEEAAAEDAKVDKTSVEALAHIESSEATQAERRRTRLLEINRNSRLRHKDKWNATRREKYGQDEGVREGVKARNRAAHARHKEERNEARRTRYATDEEYRQKLLATNRRSGKNNDDRNGESVERIAESGGGSGDAPQTRGLS